MATYLSLVTDFIRETALSGGTPPDNVLTAVGDQAKAVYWINQASLQIQREWINWDFLWRSATVNLSENSALVPSETETENNVTSNIVNKVQRATLAIMQSDGSAHFPTFMDWNNSEFKRLYAYETQPASDVPSNWSQMPNRLIVLSSPIETAGLTSKYHHYRKPKSMVNNTDVPLIPDDFTRLIVVGAKIMYAEHEDAPEVSAGSHEEYEFLLSEMQTAHLPDQDYNRESHSDADLVVVPE
jgi:hypothetical protein